MNLNFKSLILLLLLAGGSSLCVDGSKRSDSFGAKAKAIVKKLHLDTIVQRGWPYATFLFLHWLRQQTDAEVAKMGNKHLNKTGSMYLNVVKKYAGSPKERFTIVNLDPTQDLETQLEDINRYNSKHPESTIITNSINIPREHQSTSWLFDFGTGSIFRNLITVFLVYRIKQDAEDFWAFITSAEKEQSSAK